MARRALEVLRTEGARCLWLRILGQTVYRRLLLLELWVHQAPPWVPAEAAIEFGLVDDGDLAEYLDLRPDADADAIRRRLESGHVCFAARRRGTLVQTAWLALEHAWIDYLGMELPLGPNEAYAYDLYTHPAERGRRLYRAQVSEMFRFFSSDGQLGRCFPGKGERRGHWRLLVASHPEDRRWLLLTRLGARPVAVVGRVGLGRWRYCFRRRSPPIESLLAQLPARRRGRGSRRR